MSFPIRLGQVDVAVIAGPRVSQWPTVGVKTLSAICAEAGLNVQLMGGKDLKPRGVIPLPGTGGLILCEDHQGRIHRIHARAVVRFSPVNHMPDPFPGWRTEGLIPLPTARTLLEKEIKTPWAPGVVILGTGNPALRLGSELLEKELTDEVVLVETHPDPEEEWGPKRICGWEVERRRFEMAGGKIIEATPISLTKKAALLWDLRLKDPKGVRVIQVSRVISAGPFLDLPGVKESPPGSFLFEIDQSAPGERETDVEGWSMEEERGRWLGGKIAKALMATTLRPPEKKGKHQKHMASRGELEWLFRRARLRLKSYVRHHKESFSFHYDGKWIAPSAARSVKAFEGVPKQAHLFRQVASLECFEDIPCNLCEKSCPESAIHIQREGNAGREFLSESDCTACGLCLQACPSGAALMIRENDEGSFSQLTLPWRGVHPWKVGDRAVLLNRKGDSLGTARVSGIPSEGKRNEPTQLVQLDVPVHLVWEARGIRPQALPENSENPELNEMHEIPGGLIEVHLNGSRRLVRRNLTLSLAFFEMGYQRPEDGLLCPDGSCGLCKVQVNGQSALACQTPVQKGQKIEMAPINENQGLCPCQKVPPEQVTERVSQGKLNSPETVAAVTHVGTGTCHGMICSEPFKRKLLSEGMKSEEWIDWRFPWCGWLISKENS